MPFERSRHGFADGVVPVSSKGQQSGTGAAEANRYGRHVQRSLAGRERARYAWQPVPLMEGIAQRVREKRVILAPEGFGNQHRMTDVEHGIRMIELGRAARA